MRLRSVPLPWLVLVGLLLGLLAGPAGAIDVGDPAPNFTLYNLDGLPYTLTEYGSHPVLLVFLDCEQAASGQLASRLQSDLYLPYSSKGMFVLGLDCRGCSAESIRDFGDKAAVTFPLLMKGAPVQELYDLPVNSVVLVDGGGVVRYLSEGPDIGAYNATEIRSAVDGALRDANTTKTATWGLIKSLYK